MGRKTRIKPEGTKDWQVKILDMPRNGIKLINDIAADLELRGGSEIYIGNLLREWITAGAAKEAKRLKIDV